MARGNYEEIKSKLKKNIYIYNHSFSVALIIKNRIQSTGVQKGK